MNKYITSISALNIPYENIQCDWHQVEMLKNPNFKVHPLNYTGASEIFDDWGIWDCTEFLVSKGFKVANAKCATPIRAIVDILYHNIVAKNQYPSHFNLNEYMFDQLDRDEIQEKIQVLEDNISDSHKKELLHKWRLKNEI